jgi:iron complex transport system ATP-binding protein
MDEMVKHSVFKIQNLSIGYQSRKRTTIISDQINFELQPGELVGLVGANGIGKSTLLRTITLVQSSISGSIFLNEKNIHSLSNIELARTFSVVLTETPASKNLTVKELVALGRQPYTNWLGTLKESDLEFINHVLSETSVYEIQHKKCYELSDGQLQRVMIARALAQDTPLIILDEPTTHLDLHHRAYILKLLKRLTQKMSKSVLFSTHEIDLANQLCDKLIVMTEEKVYYDTPKNLISEGVFERLFSNELIHFEKESGRFKIKK